VTPSGIITTLAGNGQTGYAGDNGPVASSILSAPSSVAVDSAGNVYIADAGNGKIRRVNASTGIIATFAGNGTYAYTGTGRAETEAWRRQPVLPTRRRWRSMGREMCIFVVNVASNISPGTLAVRRVTTDRQNQHLGGGGTAHARLQRRWRPPLQAVFGTYITIAAEPTGACIIADRANNGSGRWTGRSDHQHGSRQRSSQQFRRTEARPHRRA